MRGEQEEAYRVFAAASLPWLSRTANALTSDPHVADDVVQETLVRAYVHWRRVRAADDPRAYLRRILTRCVLDAARAPRRREVPVADVTDRASTTDPVRAVEDRPPLLAALAALTPRQRHVVVLRFVEDLSVATTADLLGVAPGTVKSTTSQALALLRAALGTDLLDDPEGALR